MKLISFLAIFIFIPSAYCEYRAYQYIVKNKVITSNDQPKSHVQISTLAPTSFVAYNGGHSLVTIDLLRTWICPGNTSKQKSICPSPYEKAIGGLQ